jgi:peptidyl-prolyl cis-trans isomerase A (cyclophilin A)
MLVKSLGVLSFAVLLLGFTQSAVAADWESKKGTYAVFNTTMGKIVCKLFTVDAPKTVENFIGLAEGTKEYTDKDGKKTKGRFFDGIIFHRVIQNFMIQGGDPTGTGRGGPGYRFADEFDSGRKFDKPGILAMANAGPNTNGSQFFITHVPTPFLNNKHTIFGETVEGQDVVVKIADVKKGSGDKPVVDVVIEKLEIVRVK